ncbi:MAG: CRISPR-associated protein Cmr1 [Thermosipho sp. (in: thermotogales)]|nr:CRISPR-associated protein Cmr1 [Thermosipho sp. (in: thermotogales)]
MKKEIKVKFKTITPLWTGNVYMKTFEIRPSSLIGTLRFWFEIICYFSNLKLDGFKYEKEKIDFEKFQNMVLDKGADFKALNNIFSEFRLSSSSRIFGCNGWKGWLRIKKIELIGKFSFDNYLNLNKKITIHKKQKLYFSMPYFWGTYEVTFEIEEEIVGPIFYPLLYFMEQFKFELFGYKNKSFSINKEENDILKVEEGEKEKFEILFNENKKINVLFLNSLYGKDYSEAIKELLKIKAEKKAEYGKEEINKILPLITYSIQNNKNNYKLGFISITNFLKGSEK